MHDRKHRGSCLPTPFLTLLVLLWLFQPFLAAALDPTLSISQYSCRSWTRENGLPAEGINAIIQTSDGYLWLGTQKGLVRFDGMQFGSFELPDSPYYRNHVISSLSPSLREGLWFGLREGALASYSDRAGFAEPPPQAWLSAALGVFSIRQVSDGSVWIGTRQGAIHWMNGDARSSQFYTNTSGVWTIYEGPARRVWLGTVERGLYFWTDGKLAQVPDPDGTLSHAGIAALAEDGQGGLWVGTTWGLWHYDADYRLKSVEPTRVEIKALLLDRHGVLWIGTTGLGLARLKDAELAFLSPSRGLANENVTALFEDREGSIWIGTRNGLSQLTDVKLPIYSAADGILGRGVHGVCAARGGGIWAGMTLGVSRLNGSAISNYTAELNALTMNYTKLVFEARDGDLYMVDGNKDIEILSQGRVIAHFPNTIWPTGLTEDRQSVIVSVGGSLFRITRNGLNPYEFSSIDKPQFYWIRSLSCCRDGSILVASVDGLFRIKLGQIERWSTEDGLPDNDVHCAIEDEEGVLWAGTPFGLARIREGRARAISKRDGLPDDFILAIVPDDLGSFWITSSSGIFRVSRQNLNDFADGKSQSLRCVAFDGPDSVKSTDTTEVEYSGCKSADGRVWFPSPQGVIVINPAHLVSNSLPPPVHIQRAPANGSELVGSETKAVQPGKGDLEFQYTATSFIVPEKVRFRYLLEGYDRAWVDAGSRRSAYYTSLKPGHYRFWVQACNADGI
jgi:ligand-binding sensor domain-containing protein